MTSVYFKEGAKAFEAGQSVDSNPHQYDTYAFNKWLAGWTWASGVDNLEGLDDMDDDEDTEEGGPDEDTPYDGIDDEEGPDTEENT